MNRSKDIAGSMKDTVVECVIDPIKNKVTDENFQQNVKSNVMYVGEKTWEGGKYVGGKAIEIGSNAVDAVKDPEFQERAKNQVIYSYNQTKEYSQEVIKGNCLCLPSSSQKPLEKSGAAQDNDPKFDSTPQVFW